MRYKNPEMFSRIEAIIRTRLEKHGTPPTVAEIAQEAGIGKTTAYRYLEALKEKGMISCSKASKPKNGKI